jgi:hypothetical protein
MEYLPQGRFIRLFLFLMAIHVAATQRYQRLLRKEWAAWETNLLRLATPVAAPDAFLYRFLWAGKASNRRGKPPASSASKPSHPSKDYRGHTES